ncbi:MAG TPA: MFS transporter [Caulobacteraceae bacterium]|jgi:AAHS family 4-hydroxybenzoate transporter-like MFS transporter
MDNRTEGFRRSLDAGRIPNHLYFIVALVALLLVTDGFGTQAIGFVAPAIGKAWALKKGALTGVITMGLVGVMIGACGVTPLADRIGARRILIGCALTYGVLMCGTALAHDLPGLLWMRLLSGVALGGAMPTGIALLSEYSPTRLRATFVTAVVCGFSLGGALGGFVATLVITRYGWPMVFLVGGVAPILLAPALFLYLPESLPRVLAGQANARAVAIARKLSPGWTSAPAPTAPVAAGGRRAPVVGLFEDGLALPTLLIWVVYFMSLMVLYALSNWLPTIITDAGMPMSAANAATSFYQLAGIVGALLFSFLCDKVGSRRVLPLIFLGASVFCFLIGAAGRNPSLVVGAAAAAGLFVVGGQSAANAFVGNFYPSHVRATGIGWALGMGRLGTILGSSVIGLMIEAGAQAHTLFEICAAPGLFAALAIWLVAGHKRRETPAELATEPVAGQVRAAEA